MWNASIKRFYIKSELYFWILIAMCGALHACVAPHKLNRKKSLCWNDIDFKKTEQLLLTSPVLKKISIEKYLNIKLFPGHSAVFVLFFKNDLKGVFKPNRESSQTYSSVMAYRFSQFMEWNLIPPTVIRTIEGEKGSIQLFVDKKKFDKKSLSPIQKSNIFIHYFVTGDFDVKENHILLGKNCGKPALIDNDKLLSSHTYIPYGDYPFLRYPIKNLRFALSNHKEYEQFPIKKVQSVNLSQVNDLSNFLKKTFVGLHMINLNLLSKDFSGKYKSDNDNLYFVKWKNSYWIKYNFLWMYLVYKEFPPSVFSKKTICKLKSLNSDVLNSFLPPPPFSISKETISGILYRRDIILKKSKKFDVDCVPSDE